MGAAAGLAELRGLSPLKPPVNSGARTGFSHDVAPNLVLSSTKVCASNASITGVPSLNSNGTRISYRRNKLIRGGPNDGKLNSLLGQETQCLSRNRCFARRPALTRESRDQHAQRPLLGLLVWEPDENLHGGKLPAAGGNGKPQVVPQTIEQKRTTGNAIRTWKESKSGIRGMRSLVRRTCRARSGARLCAKHQPQRGGLNFRRALRLPRAATGPADTVAVR
jgi:hypothetical protein